MPLFYLDTSALVKRYRTEQGSDVVTTLLDTASTDAQLCTSLLTVLEVASVIYRAVEPSTPIVMVSSDRELLRAAAAAGLSALDPADGDALGQLRRLRTPQP